MNPLISIIIPAYNAEQVIKRAVKSIIAYVEKLEDIEILIIENGSTDNTVKVIRQLKKKIPQIRLLHSEKGVSYARNKGIEEANGTWLVFLDADDVFTKDGIFNLLQDAKNEKTDICFYGHMNGKEKRSVCDKDREQIFELEDMDKCRIMMLNNPTKYLQVWAKLIKKELVISNNIVFNERLRLAEDSDFMLKCLQKASNIVLKKNIIYHYMIGQASTIRSFDGNKIKDYIFSINETKKTLQYSSYEVHKAFLSYVLIHMNIIIVRETFSFYNPNKFYQKYKQMCHIIEQPIFKQAIHEIDKKQCFSLRMIPILCLKLKCKRGAMFVYWVRALQNNIRENKRFSCIEC